MDTTTLQDESSLASLFEETQDAQATVVARAKAYLDARRLKEDAEKLASRQGELLAQAELELLRAMDGAQVKSLKVEHNGSLNGLSQTQSTYYSLPGGAMEEAEFMDWLTSHGGEDLIKKTIHHSTFSSFAKELVSQAEGKTEVLHPSVKIAERRGVMLRKG